MSFEEIQENILSLKERLDGINSADNDRRIMLLEQDLKDNNIDYSQLTNMELVYVHSKLHFYNNMKNPPLTKEVIKQQHESLLGFLDHHENFDKLDE